MLNGIVNKLRKLHRDDRGADMVEYILIFAAIALPLVGVLLYYRNEISTWVSELWDSVRSGEGTQTPDGG